MESEKRQDDIVFVVALWCCDWTSLFCLTNQFLEHQSLNRAE